MSIQIERVERRETEKNVELKVLKWCLYVFHLYFRHHSETHSLKVAYRIMIEYIVRAQDYENCWFTFDSTTHHARLPQTMQNKVPVLKLIYFYIQTR